MSLAKISVKKSVDLKSSAMMFGAANATVVPAKWFDRDFLVDRTLSAKMVATYIKDGCLPILEADFGNYALPLSDAKTQPLRDWGMPYYGKLIDDYMISPVLIKGVLHVGLMDLRRTVVATSFIDMGSDFTVGGISREKQLDMTHWWVWNMTKHLSPENFAEAFAQMQSLFVNLTFAGTGYQGFCKVCTSLVQKDQLPGWAVDFSQLMNNRVAVLKGQAQAELPASFQVAYKLALEFVLRCCGLHRVDPETAMDRFSLTSLVRYGYWIFLSMMADGRMLPNKDIILNLREFVYTPEQMLDALASVQQGWGAGMGFYIVPYDVETNEFGKCRLKRIPIVGIEPWCFQDLVLHAYSKYYVLLGYDSVEELREWIYVYSTAAASMMSAFLINFQDARVQNNNAIEQDDAAAQQNKVAKKKKKVPKAMRQPGFWQSFVSTLAWYRSQTGYADNFPKEFEMMTAVVISSGQVATKRKLNGKALDSNVLMQHCMYYDPNTEKRYIRLASGLETREIEISGMSRNANALKGSGPKLDPLAPPSKEEAAKISSYVKGNSIYNQEVHSIPEGVKLMGQMFTTWTEDTQRWAIQTEAKIAARLAKTDEQYAEVVKKAMIGNVPQALGFKTLMDLTNTITNAADTTTLPPLRLDLVVKDYQNSKKIMPRVIVTTSKDLDTFPCTPVNDTLCMQHVRELRKHLGLPYIGKVRIVHGGSTTMSTYPTSFASFTTEKITEALDKIKHIDLTTDVSSYRSALTVIASAMEPPFRIEVKPLAKTTGEETKSDGGARVSSFTQQKEEQLKKEKKKTTKIEEPTIKPEQQIPETKEEPAEDEEEEEEESQEEAAPKPDEHLDGTEAKGITRADKNAYIGAQLSNASMVIDSEDGYNWAAKKFTRKDLYYYFISLGKYSCAALFSSQRTPIWDEIKREWAAGDKAQKSARQSIANAPRFTEQ